VNEEYRVDAVALTAFVAALFGAAGCSPDEAHAVSTNLVDANLAGHDSHGVGRAPRYVEMIREGLVVPGRRIAIDRDGGNVLTVDGASGFGAVIGAQAVDLGCDRGAANGVCVVALRNASHLGRIGAWAERAAAAGFLSVHFVNVRGRSLVAPYGGIDRRMATSPMSVGIPIAGGAPIILDFATSAVAEGKVMVAATGGARLPDGVLVDADGRPSADPVALYGETAGALVPNASRGAGALAVFGGHKGSGLNFMIELLAGALTGSGVNRTFRDATEQPFRNGMLSIYLDPERFAGRDYFEREALDYAAYVRSSRPAQGHDEVLIPGDKERRSRVLRLRDGIPLSQVGLARLNSVAEQLSVPSLTMR